VQSTPQDLKDAEQIKKSLRSLSAPTLEEKFVRVPCTVRCRTALPPPPPRALNRPAQRRWALRWCFLRCCIFQVDPIEEPAPAAAAAAAAAPAVIDAPVIEAAEDPAARGVSSSEDTAPPAQTFTIMLTPATAEQPPRAITGVPAHASAAGAAAAPRQTGRAATTVTSSHRAGGQ
jgi:hypothetical protein